MNHIWMHVVRIWCSSPMKSLFSFCHSYLDLSHDFHAQICFHSHFFTAHTSLGCRKCLIGIQFDRKPDKLLPRTLYKTRVTANVILKEREEDALNDALFAPFSNYRGGASKSNKTLDVSRIKVESEKVVLAPRKPRGDGMKTSYFDKCEICINCKITHNKTTIYNNNKKKDI